MKKWLVALMCVGWMAMNSVGGLILSQYYEGSSYNKWIEVYNPGPGSVDLDAGGYRAGRWANANREGWKTGVAADDAVALTGSLAEGGTILLRHASAVLPAYATADITNSGVCNFNEDDSIVLYTGETFDFANVVDALGLTGATAGNTSYVRVDTVTEGVNTDFNAADWDEYTNAEVDAAVESTNERLGYHSTGPVSLSVSFDKADGYTVEEGTTDTITATAANGTVPYGYTWASTLGAAHWSDAGTVFSISNTAPAGDFTATVTVVDNDLDETTNTISFSVAQLYEIFITTPTNGTVTTDPADGAFAGDTVTITATPSVGYAAGTITVIDASMQTVTVAAAEFTMPVDDVTVTVEFVEFIGSDLIISEVADPGDNASQGRFVELYNAGAAGIDLAAGQWYLSKQVNGGSTWDNIALTGTVAAGATYVVAGSTNYPDVYPLAPAYAQYSGSVSGNGDDGYFLYSGGNRTAGTLEDALGVVDENGAGAAWEYTDGRAVRNTGVTAGNPTWTASEWSITNSANVADMTPGEHPDGSAVLGVVFDKANGFVVAEGASDTITATAANGTEPYGYVWSSTLGGTYYTSDTNLFTILDTAPVGVYTATVVVTDAVFDQATNTVTFSVAAPLAITITPPTNGAVTTTPATEAIEGATVTITATPDGNYAVDTITVVDALSAPVLVTGDSFTMPDSAVTVTVTFVEVVAEGIVDFRFTTAPYLRVTAKDAALTVSDMALSAGTIETAVETGTYFPNEPYVEESAGWTADNQAAAKAFLFTVTPTGGASITLNGISFNAYASSAGPSAFGFDIGTGTATYAVDAPDAALVAVSQAVVGVVGETGAIEVKIQGWLNGSRASTGGGIFRLDDVVLHGTVNTGPAIFSVTVDRTNGFTVMEGGSDAITATPVNGTAPYTYGWSSTLDGAHYTDVDNVFTIETTAPVGDYSATVVATDDAAGMATNIVTFSVVAAPVTEVDIPPITFIPATGNFTFGVPAGFELNSVRGADTALTGQAWVWSNLTPTVHYTVSGTNVTILSIPQSRKIIQIGVNPAP